MNDDFELVFTFKRPDFAPAVEAIIEAFHHVFDGTDIDAQWRIGMMPLYIHAIFSGDPRQQSAALAPLRELSWSWPLFDEWHERFRREGCWPYMWHNTGIAKHGADRRRRFLGERVTLFAHTLTMSVYQRHRCNETWRSFVDRRGWRFASISCPVENAIAQEMAGTIDLADWRTLPPFFPGDRSSIQANRLGDG